MTALARVLLIDADSWRARDRIGGLRSPAVIAIGAFALLAFGRFGPQAIVDPRGAVRLVLVGFYGWIGLSAAVWQLGRLAGATVGYVPVMRVVGRAHMPVLVLGVVIQMAAVALRLLGPGLVTAVFVVVAWMPAMLVTAVKAAFGFDTRHGIRVVAGPYVVWLGTVGTYVVAQVAHLL